MQQVSLYNENLTPRHLSIVARVCHLQKGSGFIREMGWEGSFQLVWLPYEVCLIYDIWVHRSQQRKWAHKAEREMGREGSFQLVAMRFFESEMGTSIIARIWPPKGSGFMRQRSGQRGSFQFVAMRRLQGRQASRPFQGKWREDDFMILWCFVYRMILRG